MGSFNPYSPRTVLPEDLSVYHGAIEDWLNDTSSQRPKKWPYVDGWSWTNAWCETWRQAQLDGWKSAEPKQSAEPQQEENEDSSL